MASGNVKKPCAKCSKGAGVTTCDGCQQSFCVKHFVEHRQELSQRMEHIGHEHDLLRRDLDQDNTDTNFLSRINTWEKESIAKIQGAAEVARTDLHELLNKNKKELKIILTKITNELQACQESDAYTEMDISKWTGQLQELRKTLESPASIRVDTNESSKSVIHLIEICDQHQLSSSSTISGSLQPRLAAVSQPSSTSNERFDRILGDARISNDNLMVACRSEASSSCPVIYGANRYSSGVHRIRFWIEQIGKSRIFFGITGSSAKAKRDISDTSRYGWWDLSAVVVKGDRKDVSGNDVVKTGDEVTLVLDCDNRQIQLQHHRTDQLRQLPVDINSCPFPWKIVVKFQSNGDCVRILS